MSTKLVTGSIVGAIILYFVWFQPKPTAVIDLGAELGTEESSEPRARMVLERFTSSGQTEEQYVPSEEEARFFNLLEHYRENGERDKEKQALQKLAKRYPESPTVYCMLTEILIDEGEFEKAGVLVDELTKTFPNEIEVQILASGFAAVQTSDDSVQAAALLDKLQGELAEWRSLRSSSPQGLDDSQSS